MFLVRNITQGKHFFLFPAFESRQYHFKENKSQQFSHAFQSQNHAGNNQGTSQKRESNKIRSSHSYEIRVNQGLNYPIYTHLSSLAMQIETSNNKKKSKKKNQIEDTHILFSIANSPNRQAKKQTSLSISESIFPAIQDCDLKIEKP